LIFELRPGQYRITDRNLGTPFWQARVDMRNLEADVRACARTRPAVRACAD